MKNIVTFSSLILTKSEIGQGFFCKKKIRENPSFPSFIGRKPVPTCMLLPPAAEDEVDDPMLCTCCILLALAAASSLSSSLLARSSSSSCLLFSSSQSRLWSVASLSPPLRERPRPMESSDFSWACGAAAK